MLVPILTWLSYSATAFLAFLTVLSLFRTGHWIARVCDFPRLQILGLCLIPAGLTTWAAILSGWSTADTVVIAVVLVIALWQTRRIVTYTRYWPSDVPESVENAEQIRILNVNLDFRNSCKSQVYETIRAFGADLIVLIEVDEAWSAVLDPLRDLYPHREGVVLPEGRGLVLFSKLPFESSKTRYLISEKRPSIRVTLKVGWDPVEITVLHPKPPGLEARSPDTDGRYNSRERDAELVIVAKEIQQAEPMHRVVVGDLNDVAWSHTTRLFRRLSGLQDPRIGRAYLSTYHARYILLRYPLDHIFVSDELGVSTLERVKIPGSDHFGVHAAIEVPPGEKPELSDGENVTSMDEHEAETIVEEGFEEAGK